MATKLYLINNISNLHVGSGDTNYGVIDNLVQKDVNTGLPTIHSSSLKGALRKYFQEKQSNLIDHIFGDENNKPGKWKFLSADLLSRPVRSDKIPYFNATSPEAIKHFIEKAEKLGYKSNVLTELKKFANLNPGKSQPMVFDENLKGAKIEETGWVAVKDDFDVSNIKSLFGDNIVLLNHSDFIELELPVIARNHLENGKSQNLWYEEVVPYDSRFGFFVLTDNNYEKDFNTEIKDNIVQIGANASIGYGLCKIVEQ